MPADPSPPDAAETHDVVASLVPASWFVRCPSCGTCVDVEQVAEDDSGAYVADGGDMFIPCETDDCGALIRVVGVAVQPLEVVDAR